MRCFQDPIQFGMDTIYFVNNYNYFHMTSNLIDLIRYGVIEQQLLHSLDTKIP